MTSKFILVINFIFALVLALLVIFNGISIGQDINIPQYGEFKGTLDKFGELDNVLDNHIRLHNIRNQLILSITIESNTGIIWMSPAGDNRKILYETGKDNNIFYLDAFFSNRGVFSSYNAKVVYVDGTFDTFTEIKTNQIIDFSKYIQAKEGIIGLYKLPGNLTIRIDSLLFEGVMYHTIRAEKLN